MTDQKSQGSRASDSSGSTKNQNISQPGSPGPTPGKAEGDRRTVEEDLRDKGGDRQ